MASDMHGDITSTLGARIAAGEVPPGSVLTLAQLERDHDASRTVVREAVRVLESIGMVRSRRRVGITVQSREDWEANSPQVIEWNLQGPFRQQQLEALMELRVAVEPTAAMLAAGRATPAQRAELRRLADRLRELSDRGLGASDDFLQADVEFHSLLLCASRNPQLRALCDPVREVLTGRSRLGMTPATPAAGTVAEHSAVADAIARGDADEAEHHSREHMRSVRSEIRADGSLG
ncbi:MAG: FadR/GntR family transcriptional regulator [Microbacterium gubbeenense]|uniref:FadR/GntR family transcriptional regulator n=2 Tax=Microbacterium gubbeenense TaxID=159896 RepID=UPI000415ECF9|nr:FadR/GntR family transcriptional regulator [Microbacterium gubbeenense]